MEKISVIIPVHNSIATISSCIYSLINTMYHFLEIIVVDDASIDNSCQIVEEFCRNYPGTVRLIRHNKKGGPAKARNSGAKQATGEYLFFLDSDTEVFPDTLDRFIYRIKNTDAVTGIYHFHALNKGLVQDHKALLNYYFFSRKGVIEYEVFDASRAGIRAKIFRSLGGFNENLSWGMDYENEEFGYRFCAKYKNLLDPSVVVKHTFPGFKKLTKTYFHRVSLWTEIFMRRKKFESAGATSMEIGIATAALFFAIILLPLIIFYPFVSFACLLLFMIYLYGYLPFFGFVLKRRPLFVPIAVVLNIYFIVIIGMGAFWGFMRVIAGRSKIIHDR